MRIDRRTAVILHDLLVAACAWALGWIVRYNFAFPVPDWEINLRTLPLVVLIQGLIFWQFGLYRGVWRFASLPDLWNIFRAVALGTLSIALVLFIFTRLEGVPRSLFVLYPVFLVLLLGGPRLGYRLWKDHTLNLRTISGGTRVLIIGAGRAGEMLVREMLRDTRYLPVGMLDDEPRLVDAKIHGVPVLGTIDALPQVIRQYDIDMIVIALPSATNVEMQRIVEHCEQTSVPFRTVPRLQDMLTGVSGLTELREVSIDDLLGREKVELDWTIIQEGLSGKVVMVSGGGGSIGSELCHQIAGLGPASLVIFEKSEHNLYRIQMALSRRHPDLDLHVILGDVCDKAAVDHVLGAFKPDVIFHAAAYKHVPLLQFQVREAVRNNVLGTRILAEAASKLGCNKFVLISTDKAVNPVNILGASKRVAEIYCESMNRHSGTRFITVRFGNVLGSDGSVVPLFKEQIKAGGPVTVTHPDISRYFMTIREACQLILQAGAMGHGGEIFILDMGKPVKITYLAEQMIKLSGKVPGQDIPIEFTGLRAGEKLHEELFYADEKMEATKHEKIL
ncbi:MAG: polysaccharide biosynthesis protein, partial [Gammaproteobacteria bacterium]|nr:polysaccharide biosynthesis protein [Gammaproteobacteria bacterium]